MNILRIPMSGTPRITEIILPWDGTIITLGVTLVSNATTTSTTGDYVYAGIGFSQLPAGTVFGSIDPLPTSPHVFTMVIYPTMAASNLTLQAPSVFLEGLKIKVKGGQRMFAQIQAIGTLNCYANFFIVAE